MVYYYIYGGYVLVYVYRLVVWWVVYVYGMGVV